MTAFIYAIGGIFLGILIAITWALYVNPTSSSVIIILNTTLLCAILGFLIPNQIERLFIWLWKLFSN
ncbi:hypothetical protein F991_00855 [Acinetobacter sp. CIP-A165]|nr:hypothetical protein F991_00855 [Acinetobacter sp. CIP-A165]